MKHLILVLLLVGTLMATGLNPEVFYAKNSKSFHKTENCMSLSHSKTLFTNDSLTVAQTKTPCKICYREKVEKHNIIKE